MQRTAAQAEAENVAAMGVEVGKIYSKLWQEAAWIHEKWSQYVELFGTYPERVELLNRAAPSFFRTVQDSLVEDILLHLARLTDPPKSAGRSNLSLQRLSCALASAPIAEQVEDLSSTAHRACEFARDWRNRRIAHQDLALAVDPDPEPLAPASRAAIKAAIAAVVELLNAVSLHYCDSTTMFEHRTGDTDAAGLLYIIRDGLRVKEERFAKVKSGNLPVDALKPESL